MTRRIMAGIENALLASGRARAVTPSKRVLILASFALERFPKGMGPRRRGCTRFSDKKRDQAKNRERSPIRMKREPLSFVLGTNRKKDVTKAYGLVEVPICAILTRPISVGRSFRPMRTFVSDLVGSDQSPPTRRRSRGVLRPRAIRDTGCPTFSAQDVATAGCSRAAFARNRRRRLWASCGAPWFARGDRPPSLCDPVPPVATGQRG
jgi:hypothetical protein